MKCKNMCYRMIGCTLQTKNRPSTTQKLTGIALEFTGMVLKNSFYHCSAVKGEHSQKSELYFGHGPKADVVIHPEAGVFCPLAPPGFASQHNTVLFSYKL